MSVRKQKEINDCRPGCGVFAWTQNGWSKAFEIVNLMGCEWWVSLLKGNVKWLFTNSHSLSNLNCSLV